MTEIGAYSFLPWLRQGLSTGLRPAATGLRATVPVTLTLTGDTTSAPPISRNVELYGPGDVVGIDRRSIVKTEPRALATNFESNFLPYIEFQAEDFPWRYTPEAPDGHRLRPWVVLAVLKEDEFTDGAGDPDHPFITVAAAETVLPPPEQAWAWAHVHVDGDLAAAPDQIVSADMADVLPRLAAVLTGNPDQGHSRLVCPRRLDVSTTYHAFVLPLFETGRLAGLGLDPALSPSASHNAWATGTTDLPYYYRWTFRTGPFGDFEYLVGLLEPRPMDSLVGRRDVDVRHPGSQLIGIDDPALGGVLRLGGALRVPPGSLPEDEQAEFDKYENWDRDGYPQPFQRDLAAFIDLASDYDTRTAREANTATSYDATVPDPADPGQTIADPDPLITPPLYGRWHAAVSRLLTDRAGTPLDPDDNWVHQLNLDPRHRLAAGFGSEVIRRGQETFMLAAWEQIGAVIGANRRIHDAQVAKLVAGAWHTGTLLPIGRERAVALTRPVQKRLLVDGLTAHRRIEVSPVPQAVTSVAARRVLRPRGPVVRKTAPGPGLIDRLNREEVTAAPPVPALTGSPALDDLASGISGPVPSWLAWLPRLLVALALLLVVVAVVAAPAGPPFAAVLLVVAAALFVLARRLAARRDRAADADAVREDGQTPAAVDELPHSPDFEVVLGRGVPVGPTIGGAVDGPGAVLFKEALRDAFTLVQADLNAPVPRPVPLPDLTAFATVLKKGLDPAVTVPRLVATEVELPERIRSEVGDGLVEVMAYPEIDTPMAKPLIDLAVDNFLPNIGLIPPNTISLLETNQAFVEAYMVGLNHEFARELLWRGYPTDQRGSYFRQFWDVAGFLTPPGADPAVVREQLKDIPPLHTWASGSSLGDHDHREQPGDKEQEVVLVVRGELLKRYPTAVIYAHHAAWQRTGGEIDKSLPRELEEPGDGDDRAVVKSPLYEAAADPDIRFFGFDLTVPEARGIGDDAGWFFVIKERPGEPRFGFDIGGHDEKHIWNDLRWTDVLPGGAPGDHLTITPDMPPIPLTPLPPDPPPPAEVVAQAADDQAVRWHAGADAAELAYLLQQVPVLIAVHAAEMLPEVAP